MFERMFRIKKNINDINIAHVTFMILKKSNRSSYISYIGYMYFVTCDDVKNRKRKLNSLACTLNDTCVKTMHSMESTFVVQKSFETISRRPSLFSILRCILMPRTLTVFPCFKTWRKILSANKSRDVERYVCRTTVLHPPTVTFNPRYRGKVSVEWTPSGYIHRLRDPTAFPL